MWWFSHLKNTKKQNVRGVCRLVCTAQCTTISLSFFRSGKYRSVILVVHVEAQIKNQEKFWQLNSFWFCDNYFLFLILFEYSCSFAVAHGLSMLRIVWFQEDHTSFLWCNSMQLICNLILTCIVLLCRCRDQSWLSATRHDETRHYTTRVIHDCFRTFVPVIILCYQ